MSTKTKLNIITSGPIGSYTYANTGYANPHAATSINGVTNSYDNDGNLTSNGTLTNTWNYKNQLNQAIVGGITSTYTYDHTGERASLSNGTTTTIYPNDYYNTDGTKQTKSIYANGQLVATIETVGEVISPYYTHTDHLGSTNVTSNSAGNLVETLDYYPYGNQRISSGLHTEQRQYIGQMYDGDTGLDYLNARYYKSDIGKFISQDSMFWQLPAQLLIDPQQQNSYSYARNNPIIMKDPSGNATVWGMIKSFVKSFFSKSSTSSVSSPSVVSVSQNITPNINYASSANKSVVSSYTQNTLSNALRASNNSSATITSTNRTPEKQAQIMADKVSKNGISSQYSLYGPYGDRVLDSYPNIKDMTKKIYELGPGNVSSHLKDPRIVNVIDIDPSSIQYGDAFKKAIKNDDAFDQKHFFFPTADDAYHLEIPQP